MQTATVVAAVCGLLIPSPGGADRSVTAEESLSVSPPVDIVLDAQQSLRGYVVDQAGKVQPGAPVYLFRGQKLVATELTGTGGEFVAKNLHGGTYQLAVGEKVLQVRCWAAEVSPPHAQRSLLVSVADIQRGQIGPATCCLGNPWVISGIAVAAVVIPVALHNNRGDRDVSSP